MRLITSIHLTHSILLFSILPLIGGIPNAHGQVSDFPEYVNPLSDVGVNTAVANIGDYITVKSRNSLPDLKIPGQYQNSEEGENWFSVDFSESQIPCGRCEIQSVHGCELGSRNSQDSSRLKAAAESGFAIAGGEVIIRKFGDETVDLTVEMLSEFDDTDGLIDIHFKYAEETRINMARIDASYAEAIAEHDFSNTANLVLNFYDDDMNLLTDVSYTSAAGITYQTDARAVPEPSSFMIFSVLGVMAISLRRFRMMPR